MTNLKYGQLFLDSNILLFKCISTFRFGFYQPYTYDPDH
jgi:hypothetical protein